MTCSQLYLQICNGEQRTIVVGRMCVVDPAYAIASVFSPQSMSAVKKAVNRVESKSANSVGLLPDEVMVDLATGKSTFKFPKLLSISLSSKSYSTVPVPLVSILMH